MKNVSTNSTTPAVVVLALLLLSAVGTATATTPAPAFDDSGILADIATYLGIAVGLVGTYIGGKWALRAMGLLSPR